MTSASGGCVILALPLEVRLTIYRVLFGYDTATISADGRKALHVYYIQPQDRCAQILKTCRKIAEEARPVLYQSTTFLIPRASIPGFPYSDDTIRQTIPLFQNVVLDASATIQKDQWQKILMGFYRLSLQSLRVTCSIVQWVYPDRVAFRDPRALPYDDCYDAIMAGCLMLLIKTPLNTIVDESKPGRRICFDLKRVNGLKTDSRVSLILQEIYDCTNTFS